MLWKLIEPPKGRWFLSGFPKAGLHMLIMMCSPVIDAAPPDLIHHNHWAGSFGWNSFGGDWVDVDKQLRRVAMLSEGHYLKGHLGWREDINTFMQMAGIAHVFIYRDLRDVAWSQTQHILNADDVRLKHPAPKSYHALGSVDKVLAAVIRGLEPWPGLFERWELYAPWLDEEWTLAIRYEDNRKEIAKTVLSYGLERALEFANVGYPGPIRLEQKIFDAAVDEMVEASGWTNISPTFRKGQSGEWQEHFTEEHKDLFKRCDTNGWLVKLGYAEDEDW